jgi:RHS repeat-associated protein
MNSCHQFSTFRFFNLSLKFPASTYDPAVEFLEISVTVNGVKAWKVYGPDLNERFGGLQGTGGLEAVIVDGTGATTGVLNDYFGNGVATISSGTVTWNATKTGAYGPLPDSTAQPLTDATQLAQATVWRGHRIDSTGCVYFGARTYDTLTQRWLSADPLGYAASSSLYELCGDDPLNNFDPDGRVFGTGLSFGELSSAAYQGYVGSPVVQNVSNAAVAISNTDSSVTGARVYAGIGVSILDGDIFDPPTKMTDGSHSVSINGFNNNQPQRQQISADVNTALGVNNTVGIVNDSHFYTIGDAIQVIGEELGAITKPSIDTANIIQQMQGDISVVAHSQGSSVFAGATALLPDDVKSRIDYQGFGPQTYIDAGMYGLNSATNSVMGGDPIPFLSPRNWAFANSSDNYFNILPSDGNDGINSHYWDNYSPYVQNPAKEKCSW